MSDKIKNKVLTFNTVKVASAITGGKALYRALLANPRTKGIDEIADELFKIGCNVDAPTIAYVLKHLTTNLPDMIAGDGCRRSIGDLVTLVPRISGSFASPDAAFDQAKNSVYIDATTPKVIRTSLDGITVLNVTEGLKSSIVSLNDVGTNTADTVMGTAPFTITGRNIYVFADRADEGVWLVAKDGTRTKCDVTQETQNALTCAAPRLAAGAYTLLVVTRGGRAAELATIALERQVAVALKAAGTVLSAVYDAANAVADTFTGTDPAEITGANLKVNAANADEGVFLDKEDGTQVAQLTLATDNPGLLVANLVVVPAAGAYVLRVATRNGGDAAEVALATVRRAVTVRAKA